MLCTNLAYGYSPDSFFTGPVSEEAAFVSGLEPPAHLGFVRERWFPEVLRVDARYVRPVVLIQDSHCNYEAQRNIAKILEWIDEGPSGGLGFIGAEGAAGLVDLSVFKAVRDTEVRRDLSEFFMKQGFLSGIEFFAVNSGRAVNIYGLEKPDLYKKNLEVFEKAKQNEKEILAFTQRMDEYIEEKQNAAFSPLQKRFAGLYEDYGNCKIGITDYIRALDRDFRTLRGGDFPALSRMAEAADLESGLEPGQVEKERYEVLRWLEENASRNDTALLVEKSLFFGLGRIQPVEFYRDVYALRNLYSCPVPSPELDLYFYVLKVEEGLDLDKVRDELKEYEGRIREMFFAERAAGGLLECVVFRGIFENFAGLCAERREYEFYRNNIGSFNTPVEGFYEVKQALDLAAEFYEAALERDAAIADGFFEARVGKNKAATDILFTGGFHTDGIKGALKERGIPYAVITPRAERFDYESEYLRALAGERSAFGKLMETEGTRLAPVLLGVNGLSDRAEVRIIETEIGILQVTLSMTASPLIDKMRKLQKERERAKGQGEEERVDKQIRTVKNIAAKKVMELIIGFVDSYSKGKPRGERKRIRDLFLDKIVKGDFIEVTDTGFKMCFDVDGARLGVLLSNEGSGAKGRMIGTHIVSLNKQGTSILPKPQYGMRAGEGRLAENDFVSDLLENSQFGKKMLDSLLEAKEFEGFSGGIVYRRDCACVTEANSDNKVCEVNEALVAVLATLAERNLFHGMDAAGAVREFYKFLLHHEQAHCKLGGNTAKNELVIHLGDFFRLDKERIELLARVVSTIFMYKDMIEAELGPEVLNFSDIDSLIKILGLYAEFLDCAEDPELGPLAFSEFYGALAEHLAEFHEEIVEALPGTEELAGLFSNNVFSDFILNYVSGGTFSQESLAPVLAVLPGIRRAAANKYIDINMKKTDSELDRARWAADALGRFGITNAADRVGIFLEMIVPRGKYGNVLNKIFGDDKRRKDAKDRIKEYLLEEKEIFKGYNRRDFGFLIGIIGFMLDLRLDTGELADLVITKKEIEEPARRSGAAGEGAKIKEEPRQTAERVPNTALWPDSVRDDLLAVITKAGVESGADITPDVETVYNLVSASVYFKAHPVLKGYSPDEIKAEIGYLSRNRRLRLYRDPIEEKIKGISSYELFSQPAAPAAADEAGDYMSRDKKIAKKYEEIIYTDKDRFIAAISELGGIDLCGLDEEEQKIIRGLADRFFSFKSVSVEFSAFLDDAKHYLELRNGINRIGLFYLLIKDRFYEMYSDIPYEEAVRIEKEFLKMLKSADPDNGSILWTFVYLQIFSEWLGHPVMSGLEEGIWPGFVSMASRIFYVKGFDSLILEAGNMKLRFLFAPAVSGAKETEFIRSHLISFSLISMTSNIEEDSGKKPTENELADELEKIIANAREDEITQFIEEAAFMIKLFEAHKEGIQALDKSDFDKFGRVLKRVLLKYGLWAEYTRLYRRIRDSDLKKYRDIMEGSNVKLPEPGGNVREDLIKQGIDRHPLYRFKLMVRVLEPEKHGKVPMDVINLLVDYIKSPHEIFSVLAVMGQDINPDLLSAFARKVDEFCENTETRTALFDIMTRWWVLWADCGELLRICLEESEPFRTCLLEGIISEDKKLGYICASIYFPYVIEQGEEAKRETASVIAGRAIEERGYADEKFVYALANTLCDRLGTDWAQYIMKLIADNVVKKFRKNVITAGRKDTADIKRLRLAMNMFIFNLNERAGKAVIDPSVLAPLDGLDAEMEYLGGWNGSTLYDLAAIVNKVLTGADELGKDTPDEVFRRVIENDCFKSHPVLSGKNPEELKAVIKIALSDPEMAQYKDPVRGKIDSLKYKDLFNKNIEAESEEDAAEEYEKIIQRHKDEFIETLTELGRIDLYVLDDDETKIIDGYIDRIFSFDNVSDEFQRALRDANRYITLRNAGNRSDYFYYAFHKLKFEKWSGISHNAAGAMTAEVLKMTKSLAAPDNNLLGYMIDIQKIMELSRYPGFSDYAAYVWQAFSRAIAPVITMRSLPRCILLSGNKKLDFLLPPGICGASEIAFVHWINLASFLYENKPEVSGIEQYIERRILGLAPFEVTQFLEETALMIKGFETKKLVLQKLTAGDMGKLTQAVRRVLMRYPDISGEYNGIYNRFGREDITAGEKIINAAAEGAGIDNIMEKGDYVKELKKRQADKVPLARYFYLLEMIKKAKEKNYPSGLINAVVDCFMSPYEIVTILRAANTANQGGYVDKEIVDALAEKFGEMCRDPELSGQIDDIVGRSWISYLEYHSFMVFCANKCADFKEYLIDRILAAEDEKLAFVCLELYLSFLAEFPQNEKPKEARDFITSALSERIFNDASFFTLILSSLFSALNKDDINELMEFLIGEIGRIMKQGIMEEDKDKFNIGAVKQALAVIISAENRKAGETIIDPSVLDIFYTMEGEARIFGKWNMSNVRDLAAIALAEGAKEKADIDTLVKDVMENEFFKKHPRLGRYAEEEIKEMIERLLAEEDLQFFADPAKQRLLRLKHYEMFFPERQDEEKDGDFVNAHAEEFIEMLSDMGSDRLCYFDKTEMDTIDSLLGRIFSAGEGDKDKYLDELSSFIRLRNSTARFCFLRASVDKAAASSGLSYPEAEELRRKVLGIEGEIDYGCHKERFAAFLFFIQLYSEFVGLPEIDDSVAWFQGELMRDYYKNADLIRPLERYIVCSGNEKLLLYTRSTFREYEAVRYVPFIEAVGIIADNTFAEGGERRIAAELRGIAIGMNDKDRKRCALDIAAAAKGVLSLRDAGRGESEKAELLIRMMKQAFPELAEGMDSAAPEGQIAEATLAKTIEEVIRSKDNVRKVKSIAKKGPVYRVSFLTAISMADDRNKKGDKVYSQFVEAIVGDMGSLYEVAAFLMFRRFTDYDPDVKTKITNRFAKLAADKSYELDDILKNGSYNIVPLIDCMVWCFLVDNMFQKIVIEKALSDDVKTAGIYRVVVEKAFSNVLGNKINKDVAVFFMEMLVDIKGLEDIAEIDKGLSLVFRAFSKNGELGDKEFAEVFGGFIDYAAKVYEGAGKKPDLGPLRLWLSYFIEKVNTEQGRIVIPPDFAERLDTGAPGHKAREKGEGAEKHGSRLSASDAEDLLAIADMEVEDWSAVDISELAGKIRANDLFKSHPSFKKLVKQGIKRELSALSEAGRLVPYKDPAVSALETLPHYDLFLKDLKEGYPDKSHKELGDIDTKLVNDNKNEFIEAIAEMGRRELYVFSDTERGLITRMTEEMLSAGDMEEAKRRADSIIRYCQIRNKRARYYYLKFSLMNLSPKSGFGFSETNELQKYIARKVNVSADARDRIAYVLYIIQFGVEMAQGPLSEQFGLALYNDIYAVVMNNKNIMSSHNHEIALSGNEKLRVIYPSVLYGGQHIAFYNAVRMKSILRAFAKPEATDQIVANAIKVMRGAYKEDEFEQFLWEIASYVKTVKMGNVRVDEDLMVCIDKAERVLTAFFPEYADISSRASNIEDILKLTENKAVMTPAEISKKTKNKPGLRIEMLHTIFSMLQHPEEYPGLAPDYKSSGGRTMKRILSNMSSIYEFIAFIKGCSQDDIAAFHKELVGRFDALCRSQNNRKQLDDILTRNIWHLESLEVSLRVLAVHSKGFRDYLVSRILSEDRMPAAVCLRFCIEYIVMQSGRLDSQPEAYAAIRSVFGEVVKAPVVRYDILKLLFENLLAFQGDSSAKAQLILTALLSYMEAVGEVKKDKDYLKEFAIWTEKMIGYVEEKCGAGAMDESITGRLRDAINKMRGIVLPGQSDGIPAGLEVKEPREGSETEVQETATQVLSNDTQEDEMPVDEGEETQEDEVQGVEEEESTAAEDVEAFEDPEEPEKLVAPGQETESAGEEEAQSLRPSGAQDDTETEERAPSTEVETGTREAEEREAIPDLETEEQVSGTDDGAVLPSGDDVPPGGSEPPDDGSGRGAIAPEKEEEYDIASFLGRSDLEAQLRDPDHKWKYGEFLFRTDTCGAASIAYISGGKGRVAFIQTVMPEMDIVVKPVFKAVDLFGEKRWVFNVYDIARNFIFAIAVDPSSILMGTNPFYLFEEKPGPDVIAGWIEGKNPRPESMECRIVVTLKGDTPKSAGFNICNNFRGGHRIRVMTGLLPYIRGVFGQTDNEELRNDAKRVIARTWEIDPANKYVAVYGNDGRFIGKYWIVKDGAAQVSGMPAIGDETEINNRVKEISGRILELGKIKRVLPPRKKRGRTKEKTGTDDDEGIDVTYVSSWEEVLAKAESLRKEGRPPARMFVDLDEVIMRPKGKIASDEWVRDMIERGGDGREAVLKAKKEWRRHEERMLAASFFELTEQELRDVFKRLKAKYGIEIVIVTARGDEDKERTRKILETLDIGLSLDKDLDILCAGGSGYAKIRAIDRYIRIYGDIGRDRTNLFVDDKPYNVSVTRDNMKSISRGGVEALCYRRPRDYEGTSAEDYLRLAKEAEERGNMENAREYFLNAQEYYLNMLEYMYKVPTEERLRIYKEISDKIIEFKDKGLDVTDMLISFLPKATAYLKMVEDRTAAIPERLADDFDALLARYFEFYFTNHKSFRKAYKYWMDEFKNQGEALRKIIPIIEPNSENRKRFQECEIVINEDNVYLFLEPTLEYIARSAPDAVFVIDTGARPFAEPLRHFIERSGLAAKVVLLPVSYKNAGDTEFEVDRFLERARDEGFLAGLADRKERERCQNVGEAMPLVNKRILVFDDNVVSGGTIDLVYNVLDKRGAAAMHVSTPMCFNGDPYKPDDITTVFKPYGRYLWKVDRPPVVVLPVWDQDGKRFLRGVKKRQRFGDYSVEEPDGRQKNSAAVFNKTLTNNFKADLERFGRDLIEEARLRDSGEEKKIFKHDNDDDILELLSVPAEVIQKVLQGPETDAYNMILKLIAVSEGTAELDADIFKTDAVIRKILLDRGIYPAQEAIENVKFKINEKLKDGAGFAESFKAVWKEIDGRKKNMEDTNAPDFTDPIDRAIFFQFTFMRYEQYKKIIEMYLKGLKECGSALQEEVGSVVFDCEGKRVVLAPARSLPDFLKNFTVMEDSLADQLFYEDYLNFNVTIDGDAVGRISLLNLVDAEASDRKILYLNGIQLYESFYSRGVTTSDFLKAMIEAVTTEIHDRHGYDRLLIPSVKEIFLFSRNNDVRSYFEHIRYGSIYDAPLALAETAVPADQDRCRKMLKRIDIMKDGFGPRQQGIYKKAVRYVLNTSAPRAGTEMFGKEIKVLTEAFMGLLNMRFNATRWGYSPTLIHKRFDEADRQAVSEWMKEKKLLSAILFDKNERRIFDSVCRNKELNEPLFGGQERMYRRLLDRAKIGRVPADMLDGWQMAVLRDIFVDESPEGVDFKDFLAADDLRMDAWTNIHKKRRLRYQAVEMYEAMRELKRKGLHPMVPSWFYEGMNGKERADYVLRYVFDNVMTQKDITKLRRRDFIEAGIGFLWERIYRGNLFRIANTIYRGQFWDNDGKPEPKPLMESDIREFIFGEVDLAAGRSFTGRLSITGEGIHFAGRDITAVVEQDTNHGIVLNIYAAGIRDIALATYKKRGLKNGAEIIDLAYADIINYCSGTTELKPGREYKAAAGENGDIELAAGITVSNTGIEASGRAVLKLEEDVNHGLMLAVYRENGDGPRALYLYDAEEEALRKVNIELEDIFLFYNTSRAVLRPRDNPSAEAIVSNKGHFSLRYGGREIAARIDSLVGQKALAVLEEDENLGVVLNIYGLSEYGATQDLLPYPKCSFAVSEKGAQAVAVDIRAKSVFDYLSGAANIYGFETAPQMYFSDKRAQAQEEDTAGFVKIEYEGRALKAPVPGRLAGKRIALVPQQHRQYGYIFEVHDMEAYQADRSRAYDWALVKDARSGGLVKYEGPEISSGEMRSLLEEARRIREEYSVISELTEDQLIRLLLGRFPKISAGQLEYLKRELRRPVSGSRKPRRYVKRRQKKIPGARQEPAPLDSKDIDLTRELTEVLVTNLYKRIEKVYEEDQDKAKLHVEGLLNEDSAPDSIYRAAVIRAKAIFLDAISFRINGIRPDRLKDIKLYQRINLVCLLDRDCLYMPEERERFRNKILADDPGLGKTLEAIMYMMNIPPENGAAGLKVAMVVPGPAIEQWVDEVGTWVAGKGDIEVKDLALGAKYIRIPKASLGGGDVELIIYNYEKVRVSLARSFDVFHRYRVILDINFDDKAETADFYAKLKDSRMFSAAFERKTKAEIEMAARGRMGGARATSVGDLEQLEAWKIIEGKKLARKLGPVMEAFDKAARRVKNGYRDIINNSDLAWITQKAEVSDLLWSKIKEEAAALMRDDDAGLEEWLVECLEEIYKSAADDCYKRVDHISGFRPGLLVLDEAHTIRTQHTLTTETVQAISADRKLYLTATPLVGGEHKKLFTQLHTLYPDMFKKEDFDREYPSSSEGIVRLKNRLNRFMVRREAQDVTDLPPVKFVEDSVELRDLERSIYDFIEEVNDEYLAAMGFRTPKSKLDNRILRAQQAADGTFALFDYFNQLRILVVIAGTFEAEIKGVLRLGGDSFPGGLRKAARQMKNNIQKDRALLKKIAEILEEEARETAGEDDTAAEIELSKEIKDAFNKALKETVSRIEDAKSMETAPDAFRLINPREEKLLRLADTVPEGYAAAKVERFREIVDDVLGRVHLTEENRKEIIATLQGHRISAPPRWYFGVYSHEGVCLGNIAIILEKDGSDDIADIKFKAIDLPEHFAPGKITPDNRSIRTRRGWNDFCGGKDGGEGLFYDIGRLEGWLEGDSLRGISRGEPILFDAGINRGTITVNTRFGNRHMRLPDTNISGDVYIRPVLCPISGVRISRGRYGDVDVSEDIFVSVTSKTVNIGGREYPVVFEKLAVLSRFVTVTQKLKELFGSYGISYVAEQVADRAGEINKFRTDPNIPIYIGTTDQNYQALSLITDRDALPNHAARTMVLYDLFWQPLMQIALRMRRQGQEWPVDIHMLMAGSVDRARLFDVREKQEKQQLVIGGKLAVEEQKKEHEKAYIALRIVFAKTQHFLRTLKRKTYEMDKKGAVELREEFDVLCANYRDILANTPMFIQTAAMHARIIPLIKPFINGTAKRWGFDSRLPFKEKEALDKLKTLYMRELGVDTGALDIDSVDFMFKTLGCPQDKEFSAESGLPDLTLDILMSEILDHIPSGDIHKVLAEYERILDRGGTLAVVCGERIAPILLDVMVNEFGFENITGAGTFLMPDETVISSLAGDDTDIADRIKSDLSGAKRVIVFRKARDKQRDIMGIKSGREGGLSGARLQRYLDEINRIGGICESHLLRIEGAPAEIYQLPEPYPVDLSALDYGQLRLLKKRDEVPGETDQRGAEPIKKYSPAYIKLARKILPALLNDVSADYIRRILPKEGDWRAGEKRTVKGLKAMIDMDESGALAADFLDAVLAAEDGAVPAAALALVELDYAGKEILKNALKRLYEAERLRGLNDFIDELFVKFGGRADDIIVRIFLARAADETDGGRLGFDYAGILDKTINITQGDVPGMLRDVIRYEGGYYFCVYADDIREEAEADRFRLPDVDPAELERMV